MNIKTLSLAILTSFSLIACGGGSDHKNSDSSSDNDHSNNTTTPPSNSITQWSNFRLDYDNQNPTNTYLNIINVQFSIANGKLYAELEDYDEQEIYLTTTGEYLGIGPINSQYGALLGDITVNDDQFIIQPYSQIGSKGLTFTQDNKKIDLSNKSVLAAVDPYINWNVNYPQYSSQTFDPAFLSQLKGYQKLTFPQGSVCLQEEKYSNNQTYLHLYQSSDDNKQTFDRYAADYANHVNQSYIKFTQYFNATAYLYTPDSNAENAQDGVAEYQGQYLDAYLEKQGIEYNLAESIQEAKDHANQSNISAEDKSAYNAFADGLSQGCDLYNDVAIKFLKQNIK